MALVNFVKKLSFVHNLDKADVEANYASIAQAVGGAYYVNGVLNAGGFGTLDWRNFSMQAGIPNSVRTAPFNVYGVTVDFGASLTTNQTYIGVVPMPSAGVGINFSPEQNSAIYVGSTVVLRDPSNAVNAGTISVGVRRFGVDTFTSSGSWTNIPQTRATSVLNDVFAVSQPIQAGDVLIMKLIPSSAGVSYKHAVGTIWIKQKHVR